MNNKTVQACWLFVLCFCMFHIAEMEICGQSPEARESASARIVGTIFYKDGARIPSIEVVAIGDKEYTTLSNWDGWYELEVPPGIYKLETRAGNGFLKWERSVFKLEPDARAIFDINLFMAGSVAVDWPVKPPADASTIVLDHPPVGSFEYEESPILQTDSDLTSLGVRFGEKRKEKDCIIYSARVFESPGKIYENEYPGVFLTFNLSSVKAHEIHLCGSGRVLAIGNVTLVRNGNVATFDRIELVISNANLTVTNDHK